MCGIIVNVKKIAALTISLCLATGIALGGASIALAEEQTAYPESFAPLTLTDFAVGGETYALAAGNKISLINGSDKPQYFETQAAVTALDCADGVFYYATESGVYSLPEMEKCSHVIPAAATIQFIDPYTYSVIDGNVTIYNANSGEKTQIDGDYSTIKVFDGVVYGLESNKLQKITPPMTAEVIAYEIADFSTTETIKIGTAASVLKSFNLSATHFTSLADGEYVTEVNLTDLSGEYFSVGKTFRVGEIDELTAEKSALVLARVGNADIILLDGKTYIKLANGELQTSEPESAEFENGTVNVVADYAYSAPYVAENTKLFKINFGDKVKVSGKIPANANLGITGAFYKVVKLGEDGTPLTDDNGNEISGYVLANFVTEKKVSSGGEHVTGDPAFTTEDSVKTVVLILVVVALVLIAAGYITYVLTRGKHKKKSGKGENK